MPSRPRRSIVRLALAGLLHYWRSSIAVALGVAVATAVIGGALIVGDSVRGSLEQMTHDRLGPIAFAVTGPRFFTEDLATRLNSVLAATSPYLRCHPAFALEGACERKTDSKTRRASHVQVYALREPLWNEIAATPPTATPSAVAAPIGTGTVINQQLAEALNVQVGDSLTLWLELPAAIPRDTLLGKKDNDAQEIRLQVSHILPHAAPGARLALTPAQQLPFVCYLDLAEVQSQLDLAEVKPSRRDPEGAPARVNTLFITAPASFDDHEKSAATTLAIHEKLREVWSLADISCKLVASPSLALLSVESEQMFLDERFSLAVRRVAERLELAVSPVMVYLANRLENRADPAAYSMYSTVAGLDLLTLLTPRLSTQFGHFQFSSETPSSLGPRDVIVNEYLAADLKLSPGSEMRMAYHKVGSKGELPEEETIFTVRGIVRLEGPAADRQLAPTVKGITDAESFNDWEQPFPMTLSAVTKRDDAYWDEHRATPKVFLNLKAAQELWPNRYGTLTSIRLAPREGTTLEETTLAVSQALLKELMPAELGLSPQPVRRIGLDAATGATDFTGLFIGFSLFLIVSAMLLIGLLFRLGLEQRLAGLGLLGAIGFTPSLLRRMVFIEAIAVIAAGVAIGSLAAVGYAGIMIHGLRTWWVGAIGTQFLFLYVTPSALAIGVVAAVFVSLAAIVWSLHDLLRMGLRQQLAGRIQTGFDGANAKFWPAITLVELITCAVAVTGLTTSLLTGKIPQTEAFGGLSWPVVTFFLVGMLGLAGMLLLLSAWLDHPQLVHMVGRAGMPRLGLRSASRQRRRSVLTTGLVALATFLIVAVSAGQKNPTAELPQKWSGNGGFLLVAESSSPILYDLNTPAGRRSVNLEAEPGTADAKLLESMRIYSLRVRPGEDASCLNLFQSRIPTILGVPDELIARGGFKFANAGSSDPWQTLSAPLASGNVPVLGDMNTLMFNLKQGMGGTLPLPAEVGSVGGNPQKMEVTGMFDGAVFQGVLLMSETQFLKLFAQQKGFRYFLVEAPNESRQAATELLESKLAAYGYDAEPVSERLARFLAVQNTYLSTFQALGGLGLLLGTIGLATVMLRNVLERQSEFGLLRAIGFSASAIRQMVWAESALLLGWGLLAGTVAAIVAMLPHLMSTGANAPWGTTAGLLATVFAVGMLSSSIAIRAATGSDVLSALRNE